MLLLLLMMVMLLLLLLMMMMMMMMMMTTQARVEAARHSHGILKVLLARKCWPVGVVQAACH